MRTRFLVPAALGLALAFNGVALADDDIPLDQVPENVSKAVMAKFPKAEMLSAEKEEDDGKVQYEVMIRSEGKTYEVEVSSDGKVIDVDEEDD